MATRRCTCGKVTAVGDIHTCSPQSRETLVEALMEADFPSDADASIYVATLPRPSAPRYRHRIAKDASALLPILARFASPEAKREVLNQMVGANYRDAVSRGDKMEALVWLNALNYTAQVSP